MKPRGLTVVEWLAALAILAVVVALVGRSPLITHCGESVRRSSCMSGIRQIGLACSQYAIEHDGRFPSHEGDVAQAFRLITPNYLVAGKIFSCPNDEPSRTGSPLVSSNISYAYVSVGTWREKSVFPLVMDRGVFGAVEAQTVASLVGHTWSARSPHGGNGNVYFSDGRGVWSTNSPFSASLLQSNAIPRGIALFPSGPVTGTYPRRSWWETIVSR